MINFRYNIDLCQASKNQKKDKNIQCHHQKINNTLFCGLHKNNSNNNFKTYYEYMKISECIECTSIEDNIKNNIKNNINDNDYNHISDNKESNKELNRDLKHENIKNNNYNLVEQSETKKKSKSIKLQNSNILNKQNQIFKDILQNRNLYIPKAEKTISTLEYLYNTDLSDYSNTKIYNTFKKHNLTFSNKQIIELTKLNKRNDDDGKELFKTTKSQYVCEAVKSFFCTIVTANINEDKVKLIQRNYKLYIKQKNIKNRGYGTYLRSICVNDTDFCTLDPLNELPVYNFFSYTDEDKFTYGFDINSIYELIKRKKGKVKNPYNRNYIPEDIKNKIIKLYRINKRITIQKKNKIGIQLSVKNKCVDIFSKMDQFGYFTNINWLYDASTITLRYFYRKLSTYWNYKLSLPLETKQRLLPQGDIINANINITRVSNTNKFKVLDRILDVLNMLVSSAEYDDDKNLGCIIILHALSEISGECIASNPWLQ